MSHEVVEVYGQLMTRPDLKLVPLSETVFYVEGSEETEVRFDLEETGSPDKLTVTHPLRSYTVYREVVEPSSYTRGVLGRMSWGRPRHS